MALLRGKREPMMNVSLSTTDLALDRGYEAKLSYSVGRRPSKRVLDGSDFLDLRPVFSNGRKTIELRAITQMSEFLTGKLQ